MKISFYSSKLSGLVRSDKRLQNRWFWWLADKMEFGTIEEKKFRWSEIDCDIKYVYRSILQPAAICCWCVHKRMSVIKQVDSLVNSRRCKSVVLLQKRNAGSWFRPLVERGDNPEMQEIERFDNPPEELNCECKRDEFPNSNIQSDGGRLHQITGG